jgi:predicted RNA-binding Zn-ribbon protein involved in translation (DUF1610 family)
MAPFFACPFCGDTRFERLLTIDGATVAATAVAFRCAEKGHVFFVRKADTEDSESVAARSIKRIQRGNQLCYVG